MPLSETSASRIPWVEKILSRITTVVTLEADLSGNLDVVETTWLLFGAKQLVLVKQGA